MRIKKPCNWPKNNFKFTGKACKSIESDYFDLMNNFDELKRGEIK
tara:strand:- start:7499 stop:7633 length:135 start_codon:yes stop_codon:yes gene_type:complete